MDISIANILRDNFDLSWLNSCQTRLRHLGRVSRKVADMELRWKPQPCIFLFIILFTCACSVSALFSPQFIYWDLLKQVVSVLWRFVQFHLDYIICNFTYQGILCELQFSESKSANKGPLATPPGYAAPTFPSKYLQATCDISDVWATCVNACIKYL